MKYFLVFFGGGMGSLLRFLLYCLQESLRISLPVSTLFCNLIGSIAIVLATQFIKDTNLRVILISGLLGGFTTYSTFVLDIAKTPHHILYMLANLVIIAICVLIFKVLQ